MICRKVPITITPTPHEIAWEIWKMSSGDQVDMLLKLSKIYDENTSDFLMQLSYINDEANMDLFWEEKQQIIHMFESILEYLKEGGEE